jgi:c-di-AMP phosphodiesterase-like protein
MKKRPYLNMPFLVALLLVLVAETIAAWFFDMRFFIISAVVTGVAGMMVLVFSVGAQRAYKRYLSHIAEQLSRENQTALAHFPLPVAVGTEDGTVVWYNDEFRQDVLCGEEAYGTSLSHITGGYTLAEIQKKDTLDVNFAGKRYTVYVSMKQEGDALLTLLYFVDVTRLKEIAEEYAASRPVVLSVFIDNLEELFADVRDSKRAQIAGDVETLLEEWLKKDTYILQKYDSDRFLIVTDKRQLDGMIRNRFSILDTVRGMSSGVHKSITLSIGVGQGKTVAVAGALANQALEMALGRGGDQAAVKTKNGFDFYGGVSKVVERRTKVRTRMVASALSDLIQNSSKVLVMGHAFSDMDSVGSGIALALLARSWGKTAYVVTDTEKSLAKELIEYVKKSEETLFLQPSDAEMMVDNGTLLIVTDTHHAERVESPKLYQNTQMVAVIDHHRRMVNGIENAVLFYHEPSASSASEMVAELLQYMGGAVPTKLQAEALLSGIILDTRNFVIRAGARTFEAAAYLRRLGADTTQVQLLFSAGMELYRQKTALVSSSTMYRDMAISVGEGQGKDMRIAASQAANDLLTIRGVKAAFTLVNGEKHVHLSARSLGEVNVQLIMEKLGGGGHLTMAGASLKDMNQQQAVDALKKAIDEYCSEQK